jgi:hypothetical protein
MSRHCVCLHSSNGCRYCHEPCSSSCWVYLGLSDIGLTFATIASIIAVSLPDMIFAPTLIDHYTRMQKYDSNCTSQTNWFDLAGVSCTLSEPEPMNPFKSIEGLLNIEVDDMCLPAYFWEKSEVPSSWNSYWTEGAAHGGGLEIDDPVFGNSWTRYWGAHSWFN